MATKEEVEKFLREMREKMQILGIAFRDRAKNLEALAEMDILPIQRINYLKKLTYKNYKSGPNKDTHDPNKPDYYEFGIEVNGIEKSILKSALEYLGKELIVCHSIKQKHQ